MGYTHFDGVDATLFKINGTQVTATAAEINALASGGLSSAELAVLDSVTPGTGAASKAVVFSSTYKWALGSTGTPVVNDTADTNFMALFVDSGATTGDSRALYIRHDFTSTGSGEAARFKAQVTAAGAAAGGTINGSHISLQIGAAGTISGQANAARFTLEADAASKTLDANVSVITVESMLGTGITAHGTNSFIRVVDLTAQTVKNLFRLAAPGAKTSGNLFLARHADCTATHGIQIVDDAGTNYWLMVSTDTPAD